MSYRAGLPLDAADDFSEADLTKLDLIEQAAHAVQLALDRREPSVMQALRDPRISDRQ